VQDATDESVGGGRPADDCFGPARFADSPKHGAVDALADQRNTNDEHCGAALRRKTVGRQGQELGT